MSETETKKTRGPMSADARIVGAKRKLLELPVTARAMAIKEIAVQECNADLADIAQTYDDVGRMLTFVAPLSPDDRRTLLSLVK